MRQDKCTERQAERGIPSVLSGGRFLNQQGITYVDCQGLSKPVEADLTWISGIHPIFIYVII
ncbi:hypothetical protein SAMN05216299_10516 [Nitrosospira sp. Nsp14]|nr:hypothetical protein SAMN05216299_10516 [Nitrosospira sp. Nsp14]